MDDDDASHSGLPNSPLDNMKDLKIDTNSRNQITSHKDLKTAQNTTKSTSQKTTSKTTLKNPLKTSDSSKFTKPNQKPEKINDNSTVFTDVLFGQQGSSTDDDTIQFIGNRNLARFAYHGKLKKCDMEMKGGSSAEVLNYAPPTYSKNLNPNSDDIFNASSGNLEETNDEIQDFYGSVLSETGLDLELLPKMNQMMRDYELNMRLKMEISQVDAQIHASKKRLESAKQAFFMKESLRLSDGKMDDIKMDK